MRRPETKSNESAVVAKALTKAAGEMKLSQADLAKIMKVDRSTLSRSLKAGIDPHSLRGEVSLMIIRIYRSLFALSGSDSGFKSHFLRTKNKYFDGKPIDVMQSMEGLVMVNNYLDAMRGKV
ncbi:MbcA/ParS/Xre antitoxin family protein [Marinicella meishanensis]|uniref:MbcA/ParS/Xre antitoxin family protein n=1 Tax=Marinicella meishanensis TaxID=2873263 RepID=UPI001CC12F4C|nr:MbcA/ParS/Xre antitoxin family protein [Marinicella sp. NBU2979]